jgi:hypothetical protein
VRALAIVGLASCTPPTPPLYHHHELRDATSIGCLDISVARVFVPGIELTVLEWRVLNTCKHAIEIDVGGARLVAIGVAFARTSMSPRDPLGVLEPGWLDGGDIMSARIAYAPATPPASTIEIELDPFAGMSHRNTILRLAAVPPERGW